MMRRRLVATSAAALALLAATGCRLNQLPIDTMGGEPLVTRPASQLGLVLADLPPGFRVMEELRPSPTPVGAAHDPDPWGRTSAYSVTFGVAGGPGGVGAPAGPPRPAGEVVSSINAYVGTAQAQAAFAGWQSAVPGAYHATQASTRDLGDQAATYVQSGANGRATCLVGFRTHNVLASVWVSTTGTSGTPAVDTPPVDPVATALTYARLVAQRIHKLAGH
jgi:hypothetical protein